MLEQVFYQFPFICGRNGKELKHHGLMARNYEHWIERVTGLVSPSIDKREKGRSMELQSGILLSKSPKVPEMALKVPTKPLQPPQQPQQPQLTQSEKPTSSAEAFNQVLKMMNDTPADNNTEIDDVQEEVKELGRKLQAQDQRCSNLQAEHKKATELKEEQRNTIKLTREELWSTKQAHAGLKVENEKLQITTRQTNHLRIRLQEAYDDAKKGRKAAEQELGGCKESLTKKDEQLAEKTQQLEAAKTAASDADERVMKIWTEMKKSKESEQRKRGAGDGAGAIGSEAKKAKFGS
jgi:myosin heavy subunit